MSRTQVRQMQGVFLSKESFENAVETAIERALLGPKSTPGLWVRDMNVHVTNTDVVDDTYYRVTLLVTLLLEDSSVLVEDTKPPDVAILMPHDGETYTKNQVVKTHYACRDVGGSGLASCMGHYVSVDHAGSDLVASFAAKVIPNGAPIDTSAVARYGLAVNAVDIQGNSRWTPVIHYHVIYAFKGEFFQPEDKPPKLNTVKAGSAVPVKFSLSGNQGLGILASDAGVTWPRSKQIPCDADATIQTDVIEQPTVTPERSSLSYDSVTDQYTYVWKTDKAWAETCRQFVLKLEDDSYHWANFKFTK